MILNSQEIRARCLSAGVQSLVTPFHEEQLQGASYDLSIGNSVHVFSDSVKTISLNDEAALNHLYEEVDLSSSPFLLKPNQYVLVKVQESLFIPTDLVAHIRPRTRFTRLGIMISPQHCNPGYHGQLQLGLHNISPNTIRIPAGICVAQVIFETMSQPCDKPYSAKQDAAYQGESQFIGPKFNMNELSPEARALYQSILTGEVLRSGE
ncbi:dCTP deaminase [Clostridium sp. J1101437_171009_A5]|uniref:dCTP deaminase n=1 Tax=Clostridium sp. J1101437_171009_A5 TaxID=2787098 RepID=UPI001899389A|nr:dCTP deaminase [Clostridium sp. J1101437_171009_A5]